ncbi:ABC transporter ATP-binding protein [Streptomyces sp. 4F14]|uniref:ABC transporter ATP-binding protein n=1 Tax=Streptomyces sp. 4F14 TaxID=3394380 RepID=UPI003A88000D
MSVSAVQQDSGLDRVAARARGLTKAYGSGETAVLALDGVDVDIARGRFTAVMGPSGSGKSTLMHCLAGLDSVSAGRVWLGDTEVTTLNDRELTRLRRDRVGFMFQSFNLIPTLTAGENITLPMDIAGREPDRKWLAEIIGTLGLRDRLKHRPAQLSGGQQQRVACARALVSRPDLIFADEPTGNLDSRAGLEVLTILRQAVDALGQTVVMVTHDPTAAAHSDLVLFLADGRIVEDMERPTAEGVLERLRLFAGGGGASPEPDGAGVGDGEVHGRDPARGTHAGRAPDAAGAGGTRRPDDPEAGPGATGGPGPADADADGTRPAPGAPPVPRSDPRAED